MKEWGSIDAQGSHIHIAPLFFGDQIVWLQVHAQSAAAVLATLQ